MLRRVIHFSLGSLILKRAAVLQTRSLSTAAPPPYRSMLFVPSDSERKLQKIQSVDADACILDFEDGVAQNRKEAARETYTRVYPQLQLSQRCAIISRINAHTFEDLAKQDLKCVLTTRPLPTAILMSKVESVDALRWLKEQMQHWSDKFGGHHFQIFTMVETAKGLVNLKEICEDGSSLENESFHHEGLVFGHMDYCTDIGADTSDGMPEIAYARQKVVTVAKAFDLQAVDGVWTQVKDLDGCRQECEQGRRMGFTGKAVVYPTNAKIANEVFFPHHTEWAERLIDAQKEFLAAGKGAFMFEGHMVDEPIIARARRIIKLAQSYRDLEDSSE